jgi:hypothetical protein
MGETLVPALVLLTLAVAVRARRRQTLLDWTLLGLCGVALPLFRPELVCCRDQDHLRSQSDNSFETRMKCVTNLSHGLCFRRIITVTRTPNQTIASSNRENDLRQIWRKGDDSIDARRQTYTPSCVVRDFSRVLCWRVLMTSARSEQYYECEPGEFSDFEM